MVGVESTIFPFASRSVIFLVNSSRPDSAVIALIHSNKQSTIPRMIRNKQETARLCLFRSLRVSIFGLCRKRHAHPTSKAVIFFSSSRLRVFNCPIKTIIYVKTHFKAYIILLHLESFLHFTHISLNQNRIYNTVATAACLHSSKCLNHISTIKTGIVSRLVFSNAQLQITNLFENRGVFRFVSLVFLQLLLMIPNKRTLTDLST